MNLIGDDFLVFSCILDFGKGSKALDLSRDLGGVEETIFLGKGTVRDNWLNILGAKEVRKEILVSIIDKEKEDIFYEKMTEKFSLDKPHHGIVFSMPLKYCFKIKGTRHESSLNEKGVEKMAYECIFVIVDKGLSVDVLSAAESAGSTGGTVIHGRGSGTQEKASLFNIKIEPEKDIVMILSKTEKTDSIVDAIEKKLNINDPGTGIVFVLCVSRTLGLYQG